MRTGRFVVASAVLSLVAVSALMAWRSPLSGQSEVAKEVPAPGSVNLGSWGVPPGTLIAWVPPASWTTQEAYTFLQNNGWVVCDGSAQQKFKDVPDMDGQYLIGSTDIQDVKTCKSIGSKDHGHAFSATAGPHGGGNPVGRGGDFAASDPSWTYPVSGTTSREGWDLPRIRVLFIMKRYPAGTE